MYILDSPIPWIIPQIYRLFLARYSKIIKEIISKLMKIGSWDTIGDVYAALQYVHLLCVIYSTYNPHIVYIPAIIHPLHT